MTDSKTVEREALFPREEDKHEGNDYEPIKKVGKFSSPQTTLRCGEAVLQLPLTLQEEKKASAEEGNEFMVLEEISSDSDDDDIGGRDGGQPLKTFCKTEETSMTQIVGSSTVTSGPQGATSEDNATDDLSQRNVKDLWFLIRTLEENATPPVKACVYCYRVDHLYANCPDKGKDYKKCPIWMQGMMQRRYFYYDANPNRPEGHKTYKDYLRAKNKKLSLKRWRRREQRRQEKEKMVKEKRLETAEELLQMAKQLIEIENN